MGFNFLDRTFIVFLVLMAEFNAYEVAGDSRAMLSLMIAVLVFSLFWEIFSENLGYRALEYFRGDEN